MSNADFDVTVEESYDKRGNETVLVKIATAVLELNIHIQLSQVKTLISVANSDNFYCDVGESANSLVHWKKESSEEVYILIGDDQDVWDICLVAPSETFDKILSELKTALRNR